MTTAAEIITYSARALGFLGRTETLSAGDANDGLVCFNNMLNSWSNEQLLSYVTLQRSFPLSINTQSYSIGSGGAITATRPQAILSAFVRDSNDIDYPMAIYNRFQWDSIGQKDITSQIPNVLFYDSTYPLGAIYVFPIPLVAYTVFYNSTLNQALYALNDPVDLPPGYLPAYIFNLAVEMMSFGFPCMLNERDYIRLNENAVRTKADLKRTNQIPPVAEYDPQIWSRSEATYNVYSDGWPRG